MNGKEQIHHIEWARWVLAIARSWERLRLEFMA
jgi:hypothetical protein